ncbi:MAG: o-succinylbenzoate synthase [Halovenus sp.]
MLTIEPFTVRLTSPLGTARGSIHERRGFLLALERGGERGIGEATPLTGWTESYEECRNALERAQTAASHLDWGIALTRIEEPAARHGLSLALATARARAANQPLYRSLGRDQRVEDVPVNAVVGAANRTPEAMGEVARQAADEGFEALKLKIGTDGIEEDIERVRAVRNAVGPAVELRVDANAAWTYEQARDAIDAFAALDVAYVEQPLPAGDLDGLSSLRGNGVDVALDESLATHDIGTVLAADAADVVVLKPMVVGGPDLAAEAATQARSAGVTPVVSTTIDAAVARTAAVHVAATVPDVRPCGLATAELLATDVASDPAPVANGTIRVPQERGLGLPGHPIE